MGKAPAFQFYVKDWLSDPQLKMASFASKGIWIDLLAYMWSSPNRGEVTGTMEQIAKLLGASNGDLQDFINEAKDLNFADVTFCNKKVTIKNRRMFREQQERDNTKKRVRKYRRKKTSNGESNVNVTPLSPTPSPSPTTKKNIYDRNLFKKFWDSYPKKVGKQEAIKAFKKIKRPGSLINKMIETIERYKNSEQWNAENGQFIPNPATWLNRGQWEDELPETEDEKWKRLSGEKP